METPVKECPRCGRMAAASGSVRLPEGQATLYQCETCVVSTSLLGMTVDVALTFAYDAAGRLHQTPGK